MFLETLSVGEFSLLLSTRAAGSAVSPFFLSRFLPQTFDATHLTLGVRFKSVNLKEQSAP